MTSQQSVTILALGLMGAALAQTFLKNGWMTTVWNRSLAKAELLTSQGATAARTPTEAVRASQLIVVCVTDLETYLKIVSDLDESTCKGRTIVNFTTGSPLQIEESERLATTLGVEAYLHGAIMTMPAYIGLPGSTVYYSGSKNAFDSFEAGLKFIGKSIYIDKDAVSAALQESIIVTTFYGLIGGFLQSMALMKESKQLKDRNATEFLSEVLEPAISNSAIYFLRDIAKQIDARDYQTKGEGARLELQMHALRNIRKGNKELGVSFSMLEPVLKAMEDRVAGGGKDEELGALVEIFKNGAASHGA